MAYRGTEAYDFSLFEPQIIEQPKIQQRPNVQPKRKGAPNNNAEPIRRNAPSKKAQPKKSPVKKQSVVYKDNIINAVENHQTTVARKTQVSAVPVAVKKAVCFCAACFVLLVVFLVLQSQNDSLMNEIATVQKEIKIEQGESVRLNAELSSKISTDKIETYAEDVLGMVKAENYQISYIDLSDGDEIVVSGDKEVSESESFTNKVKSLFAYIF